MQRVKDETLIDDPNDEELVGQTAIDEFDKYFSRQVTPKILVTTNRRPKGVSKQLFMANNYLGFVSFFKRN